MKQIRAKENIPYSTHGQTLPGSVTGGSSVTMSGESIKEEGKSLV